jgi:hypothetical protein
LRLKQTNKQREQPNLLAHDLLGAADAANATSVCARVLLLGKTGAASAQLLQLERNLHATSLDAQQASAVAGSTATLGTGANDATAFTDLAIQLSSDLSLLSNVSDTLAAASAVARLFRLSDLELSDAKSALGKTTGHFLQLAGILDLQSAAPVFANNTATSTATVVLAARNAKLNHATALLGGTTLQRTFEI